MYGKLVLSDTVYIDVLNIQLNPFTGAFNKELSFHWVIPGKSFLRSTDKHFSLVIPVDDRGRHFKAELSLNSHGHLGWTVVSFKLCQFNELSNSGSEFGSWLSLIRTVCARQATTIMSIPFVVGLTRNTVELANLTDTALFPLDQAVPAKTQRFRMGGFIVHNKSSIT